MVDLPDEVQSLYPFDSHFADLPAGRIHYVDEGPKDAPLVVCVHGNPTWSFYWREMVLGLRSEFRVIAFDHLGCGLSDKPQTGFRYRLADHIENFQLLLETLGIQKMSLVAHDWGGAIGTGVAVAEPDRIQALILSNTAAFRSTHIPLSIACARLPLFGALAVRGANAFVRAAVIRATEKGLSPAVTLGLTLPYNSWAHRIAVHRFVQDIPMHPRHPSWSTLTHIENGLSNLRKHPIQLLWGDADWCFSPRFREEWMRQLPQAEVHAWADVGHYVMEDAADRAVHAARTFLQRELCTTASPSTLTAKPS